MDFTAPYLENDQVIVVKRFPDQNQSWFSWQKCWRSKRFFGLWCLHRWSDQSTEAAALNEYPENVSALSDLGIGRIDAVIVDSIVARYYITSEKAEYVVLIKVYHQNYTESGSKAIVNYWPRFRMLWMRWLLTTPLLPFPTKWFGEDNAIYKP